MMPVQVRLGRWCALCIAVALTAGCRFEGTGTVDPLEYRLVNESWSSFSELFSADRGYRIAFLPFNVVARESGRMSETWKTVDDGVLEFRNSTDRQFRYRWFDTANLLVHCREGYAKPFFVAPDTLTPREVFHLARRAGLDRCSPTTILRIAGGRITWANDRSDHVQIVDLSDRDLTRQDRAAMRDVESMETLILSRSDISDVDLGYLARLSSLTNLSLEGNPITDAGLAHLTGLPLVGLDLSSTAVTDKGMKVLGNISTLRVLYVANTSVTQSAVDSLQRVLPKISIRR